MATSSPSRVRTRTRDERVRLTWRRALLANLILAGLYALLGTISLLLIRETGASAPVWPGAGIAVAAVFLRGPVLLPGIVIGSFTANLPGALAADDPVAACALALALGLAGAAGAYAGGTLARRFVGARPPLVRGREILGFLALAALVGAAVSATLGAGMQVVAGIVTSAGAPLAWLTWFVGDALGIIVFLPICVMLAPEQSASWQGRRWKVALPSLIVLVGITAGIMLNAGLVQGQRDQALGQQANEAAVTLQNQLSLHIELLNAISSHHRATGFTSAEEFRTFTSSFLSRHDDIEAVSWNPVIDGTVPVTFIEPLAGNAAAVGFDVNADPVRADAIARARSTGQPQLTAPITLVQTGEPEAGALMFVPSMRDDGIVDGFAVGVYRLGDLLSEALGQDRWREWNFELTDVTPGEEPRVIAGSRVEAAAPTEDRVIEEPLAVGGRMWTLAAWPTAALLARQAPVTSPLLLIGGLVLAFLLESFLLLVTGLERRARREADTSTFEAEHDALTGLLNRRGFFTGLHAVRDRVANGEAAGVLLFCDLDGFKQVNDTLGHEAGDALLRGIATDLRSAVRERDVVGRIGGDEFALVLTDCDLPRAEQIAATIQAEVTRRGIGLSAGIVPITGTDVPEPDALMRAADAACYEAKRAGRSTVRIAQLR